MMDGEISKADKVVNGAEDNGHIEKELKIHDWLSIGDVDHALSSNHHLQSEVDRLPLFLRQLSSAQGLSEVPNILSSETDDEKQEAQQQALGDPLVSQIAQRLEKVAATHPKAESVDVLVAQASTITRRVSKVNPIRKRRQHVWVQELESASLLLSAYTSTPTARSESKANYTGESDDNLGESGDEMDVDDSGKSATTTTTTSGTVSRPPVRRLARSASIRDSVTTFSDDSEEGRLQRLMAELTSLVTKSLSRPKHHQRMEEQDASTAVTLKPDSLLANTESAIGLVDVGDCVAALLHHAPALKYSAVVKAMLQAKLPLTHKIIYSMASNSPNAVPCILKGYCQAMKEEEEELAHSRLDGATPTTNTASTFLSSSLHTLSHRESSRIRRTLHLHQTRQDAQLILALDQDIMAAALLLSNITSCQTSIWVALRKDAALSARCVDRLRDRLAVSVIVGEQALFLRALVVLLLHVENVNIEVLVQTRAFVSDMIQDEKFSKPSGLVHCFALLLCCRLVNQGMTDWQPLLKVLLGKSEPPESRISVLLHSPSVTGFRDYIKERVDRDIPTIEGAESLLYEGFQKLCKWAVVHGSLEKLWKPSLEATAVVKDPQMLVQCVESEIVDASQTEAILTTIMRDAKLASQLLDSRMSVEVLYKCVSFLVSKESVPVVLSRVECNSIQRRLSTVQSDLSSLLEKQLALHTVLLLLLFALNSSSPLAVHPLDPLIFHNMWMVRKYKKDLLEDSSSDVRRALFRVVPSLFREVDVLAPPSTRQCTELDWKDAPSPRQTQNSGAEEEDGSKWFFEREYLHALQSHSPCLAIASVIDELVTKTSPRLGFSSYAHLAGDPLVVLQCPRRQWKREGSRRVALSVIEQLMRANDMLTHLKVNQLDSAGIAKRHNTSKEELSAARNAILLHCLLNLQRQSEEHSAQYEDVSCLIRLLVAQHRGLVGILAKQGISDQCVDWLVDFVPESINEAAFLSTLLSDRGLTTSSARDSLRIADIGLRLSLAFGNGGGHNERARLLTMCLYQLLTSFGFILGPSSGVSIDALMEDGVEVTQVCRGKAMRMFAALHNAHHDRSECTAALRKVVTLLKGEGSGSNLKNKALIKEVWDALVKALSALGAFP